MNTFIPDFSPDARHDEKGIGDPASASALSLESQLRLREFYEYIDNSRTILNEIREELSSLKSNSDDCLNCQKTSERLARFCTEADSWGFNDLYEVGMGIQIFLLNSGGSIQNGRGIETLNRGLTRLSELLHRCENEYRWRLSIADTQDSFDRAI
jgi:hypothetical protein